MILSATTTTVSPASSLSPLCYPPQCCRRVICASSTQSFPFTGRTTVRRLHSRRALWGKTEGHQSVQNSAEEDNNEEPEEDIKVLTAIRSIYNEIMILETPEARLLLLDSSHNVHSIFNKGGGGENNWTNSYWDEFASLPPIVPSGVIAIFGLGGGTAAKLMLELYPWLELEGWEIDEILIDKCREHLELSELEKRTNAGGRLNIRIGDALSANASVAGGYAGIIVDLFADGKVLPELEEVKTWMEIREKLMPNGRIMVNCGGGGGGDEEEGSLFSGWEENSAIRAMSKAFPEAGELNWKLIPNDKGANFLALTGALPCLPSWSSALPPHLTSSVYHWRLCLPS